MYKEIIIAIDAIIEQHEKLRVNEYVSRRDEHYFIQGLKVAKQQVEQLEELHIEELPHETFEDVVKALKGEIGRYDMEEIIEQAYKEEK